MVEMKNQEPTCYNETKQIVCSKDIREKEFYLYPADYWIFLVAMVLIALLIKQRSDNGRK